MKGKKIFIVGIVIFLVILAGIFVLTGLNSSEKTNISQYDTSDYENYQSIANYIFEQIDNSNMQVMNKVSDSIKAKDFIVGIKDTNIKKLVEKYENQFFINIVDGNVILFNTDSIYQSAYGIAITRNNAEPKYSYEHSGYDEGISYEKQGDNIYTFKAGL